MTKYGHIAWRLTAVVAFAGTAALAVTLSRVPVRPDHASLSSNLTQSPCATSELEAWLGLAQTPLKSGLPLGRRGAGAFMSGLVFRVWAVDTPPSAAARAITHKAFLTMASFFWCRWFMRSIGESGIYSKYLIRL